MKRFASAFVLVVAGFSLAACGGAGGSGQPTPAPPAPSPLASFDPCTVLDSGELQSHGGKPPGRPVDQGIGEPGCKFRGDPYILAIYKAEHSDLNYWQDRRGNFATFEPNKVGNRSGIKVINKGSEGLGSCRQIVEAGGGSVSTYVQYRADKTAGGDPCAEAMKIAQQVEPKLPR